MATPQNHYDEKLFVHQACVISGHKKAEFPRDCDHQGTLLDNYLPNNKLSDEIENAATPLVEENPAYIMQAESKHFMEDVQEG